VLLGTHKNSESDDGDDNAICDDKQMGMGEMSRIFMWQNSATQEIFCGIRRPQFNTSGMDIAEVFQKFFLKSSYATYSTRDKQICTAPNSKKCHPSHFAPGSENNRMLQWMRCMLFWPFSY
jgi:hypothetical protein